MEVTGKNLTLLNTIRPPNLEDAGLEDCALPPDSIKEAFLKAASAVGSRAASVFAGDDDEIDGGCVNDPWMKKSAPSDALVGVVPESDPPVSKQSIMTETMKVEIRRPAAEDLSDTDKQVCSEVKMEKNLVSVAEGTSEALAMAGRGELEAAHSHSYLEHRSSVFKEESRSICLP